MPLPSLCTCTNV